MRRIDFLARKQIVERANSIPGPPCAKKFADEKLLITGPQMLANAVAMAGFEILIQVLQAFALTNRIENEHDIAQAGEALGETLIAIDGFARCRVAATADYARQGQLAVRGNIQVGRDWKIRPALEDDFFDLVRVTFDDAGDAG